MDAPVAFLLLLVALFIPMFCLIVVANLGERSQNWRVVAYLGMCLLAMPLVPAGLLLIASALLTTQQGAVPSAVSPVAMLGLGSGLIGSAVVALVALLAPVRRLLARAIPLRPDSIVNAVALSLLVIFVGASLSMVQGLPKEASAASLQMSPLYFVAGEVPFAIAAILGVGLLVRRQPREVWERLGLRRLSWKGLLLALGGLAALLIFEAASNIVAQRLWPESYAQLERASKGMYGGINTPLAAVVVSLAAGVCEETLFRGALQPRFGLLVTSLAFGVSHVQYGLTWALFTVFIIGLVLGIYRQRLGTTSCILIHSLYNTVLFLIAAV